MLRCVSILLLLLCIAVGQGAERGLVWPQFRGPGGSGVADGQKPPVQFGPEQNVQWKITVPSGLSSPIIAGDLVVITAFDGGKLYTIAYRSADGKEAWRQEAPVQKLEPFHKTQGSPAASTPATDGPRIVSFFGSCGLVCYDLSGKQLWKYEMSSGGPMGDFGSGVSPVIADGTVVLVRDAVKDSRIVALDAVTGALKWEKKRQSTSSFSTPVVWETAAAKQIVAAGHARMIAYDLQDGTEQWSVNAAPTSCCSSPVTAEGLLLFAGASGGDDMPMPTYDSFLKDLDKNNDGALDRAEAEKAFEGFFDNQDTNKDGKFTRDEWDFILKLMAEGRISRTQSKRAAPATLRNRICCGGRRRACRTSPPRSPIVANTSWSRMAESSPRSIPRPARKRTRRELPLQAPTMHRLSQPMVTCTLFLSMRES